MSELTVKNPLENYRAWLVVYRLLIEKQDAHIREEQARREKLVTELRALVREKGLLREVAPELAEVGEYLVDDQLEPLPEAEVI